MKNANDMEISTAILQLISARQAHEYRLIPFKLEKGRLHLYTDEAAKNSSSRVNELSIVLNKEIVLHCLAQEQFNNLLFTLYRETEKPVSIDFSSDQDFLLQILLEAKQLGSSDIHFEIYEYLQRVRFRIDGKMIERFIIPQESYPVLINKIKIQSQLDISEKRLPQDGRMKIKYEDSDFDVRVSVLPTLFGEKIVLRILSKDSSEIELSQVGFDKENMDLFLKEIRKTNGIILISGPTGSGKTTTLYAAMKTLNTNERNILTIEDPIEYTLHGINQVQLKEQIGLTFGRTLRTFLRQDPDIIMVGEIRDEDTAHMAVRASLTGHLVFSTIHTNSALATISRLIDMGVPPFLIASTLNLSIAQRLIRLLCQKCKQKTKIDQDSILYKQMMHLNISYHYYPCGCKDCYYTGYKGRKAIFEIIPVTKELTKTIKQDQVSGEYLKENNIKSLEDRAKELYFKGLTSMNEVFPYLHS